MEVKLNYYGEEVEIDIPIDDLNWKVAEYMFGDFEKYYGDKYPKEQKALVEKVYYDIMCKFLPDSDIHIGEHCYKDYEQDIYKEWVE